MKTKRTYVRVWVLAVIMAVALALGGTGVYASGLWAEWTGQNEIVEVTAIATQMVVQINEYEADIVLLDAEILALENDATILQAQLDTLLAQSGSKIQEIADLTAELATLTIAHDQLVIDLGLITAERDQLVIDLQAAVDENTWLAAELATANADMAQFAADICAQVDLINSDNKRAAYDTWCGVRP